MIGSKVTAMLSGELQMGLFCQVVAAPYVVYMTKIPHMGDTESLDRCV